MIWDGFQKYKENSRVNIAVFDKFSCQYKHKEQKDIFKRTSLVIF